MSKNVVDIEAWYQCQKISEALMFLKSKEAKNTISIPSDKRNVGNGKSFFWKIQQILRL